MILAFGFTRYFVRRLAPAEVRRAPPWDCGFGGLNPKMQYTATAFGQPIRRIFSPVFELRETVQTAGAEDLQHAPVHYHLEVGDRSWRSLYAPVGHGVEALARRIVGIQTGHLRTYIAYSFVTLVFLLGVVSS